MNIRKELLPLLGETWSEFQKDEAEQRGAALAFYSMFSIFPLLILMLAALGFVLRYQESAISAQEEILQAAARYMSPQFGDMLRQMFVIIQDRAGPATGVGLITLFIGASSVFSQLDSSFRKIWRVPPKPHPSLVTRYLLDLMRNRLFAFTMMLGLGPLLIVSMVMTALTQPLVGMLAHLPVIGGAVGYLIGLALALLLNTMIFVLLFKYLPGTEVKWGDVMLGAILTALVWEIAKRLLTFYIARSSYVSAYGIVGTVLALMIWIYFSSQVLFLGAEFTEVYSRRRGSRPRRAKDSDCDENTD
jgi:membrane protein